MSSEFRVPSSESGDPGKDSPLCFESAVSLARRLRARELSAREVMEAHLAQVERLNPAVNAIVTLVAEQATAEAAAADERLARREPAGPLHGLPIAHKDLFETAGIRTTFGSPLFRDYVPKADDPAVGRVRAAGAITIGKTNVPEFGAGSQTYNEVFGATRNPYDLAKTCGGSSGGAAVALACGMVPLADGSDVGGSLRNPANFCNVVGFRTSPGLVPAGPGNAALLPVAGPMGRTVEDVALLLSVQAGFEPSSPLSFESDGARFREPLERDLRGLRVAWSRDLGGLPVDPRVAAALDAQRATFEALGCIVEDAEPEFAGADFAFETFRAHAMAGAYEGLLRDHRAALKDTVAWNIEAGLRLTAADLRAAESARAALFAGMHAFFARFDVLACPVNQVPPFPVEEEYVAAINGAPMHSYIEWMRSCSRISMTSHPAISVPAGFTPEGLPVGIQLVGRYRGELELLQVAYAFEQATGFAKRRPPGAATGPLALAVPS
ncbi:MAG: amidase [Chloroflexi bacterium]|nr:amidase [Chloroflexota bacterium]